MAKHTSPAVVILHWYKLLWSLQALPTGFYVLLKAAIKRHELPDASTSEIEWRERHVLSTRRGCPTIGRDKPIFATCGVPSGAAFEN